MRGCRQAGPFQEPVDWRACQLFEYPWIVTNPMDLGTIERRLCSGGYCSAEAVARDMRLTFTNALVFNPDVEDPIHQVKLVCGCVVCLLEPIGDLIGTPTVLCLLLAVPQAALRLSRTFEAHWATLKLEAEPEAASSAATGVLAKKKKPPMFNKVPQSRPRAVCIQRQLPSS